MTVRAHALHEKLRGTINHGRRGRLYLQEKTPLTGPNPSDWKTAYGLIREADVWLNVGMATTLDELKIMNPKFKDAGAIEENEVYNNNLRLTPEGGNDYWESARCSPGHRTPGPDQNLTPGTGDGGFVLLQALGIV